MLLSASETFGHFCCGPQSSRPLLKITNPGTAITYAGLESDLPLAQAFFENKGLIISWALSSDANVSC